MLMLRAAIDAEGLKREGRNEENETVMRGILGSLLHIDHIIFACDSHYLEIRIWFV